MRPVPGFLGIDVGTSRCKAALFDGSGLLIRLASEPTPVIQDVEGNHEHDPDELWHVIAQLIRQVAEDQHREIEGVGVASMAEAGLLLDPATGQQLSPLLSWQDQRPAVKSELLESAEDVRGMFARSGLHPSPKYGLPKLLWLSDQGCQLQSAVWLSVADYIVYRLTGSIFTDPSLAARTFVYDIRSGRWDESWIRHFGFDPSLFPPVLPSGAVAGTVSDAASVETGLSTKTEVAIAGHDHVVALMATGVSRPGSILDSSGTAESLIGVIGDATSGDWFDSGLAVVPHVLPGKKCWLGGISASGGSLDWLERLGIPARRSNPRDSRAPGTILYFPYLLGAGAPAPDRQARAAFVGLDASHGPEDLAQAVFEGTAFEAESIRRAAERSSGKQATEVVAVGGGTRLPAWVQIKADVLNLTQLVPPMEEAVCFGAALLAGLGSGALSSRDVDAAVGNRNAGAEMYEPDPTRHDTYRRIYEDRYLPLQVALRRFGRNEQNRNSMDQRKPAEEPILARV